MSKAAVPACLVHCILMQFRDNEVGDVHTYTHWGIYQAIFERQMHMVFLTVVFRASLGNFKADFGRVLAILKDFFS